MLREYGLKPDSSSTDKDLDAIEAYYFLNGGYIGLIEVAGEIVATLGLYRIDEQTCELNPYAGWVLEATHHRSHSGEMVLYFEIGVANWWIVASLRIHPTRYATSDTG